MIRTEIFNRLEFLFAHEHLPEQLTASASCSELALAVVRNLGGRVVGYWNWDNPGAAAAPDCDGHDFALLEGRYIVDIWVRDVAHTAERAVFDLADPEDRALALHLYGEPAQWTTVSEAPERLSKSLTFAQPLTTTANLAPDRVEWEIEPGVWAFANCIDDKEAGRVWQALQPGKAARLYQGGTLRDTRPH